VHRLLTLLQVLLLLLEQVLLEQVLDLANQYHLLFQQLVLLLAEEQVLLLLIVVQVQYLDHLYVLPYLLDGSIDSNDPHHMLHHQHLLQTFQLIL
jgi:hypothetical protein